METIESIEHNGLTINIHPDHDPMSPRDDDNLGEILYCSSRYVLGDREVDSDEMRDIAESKDNIVLPVFAHIHSGVMLNTGGFGDPWDSGQSGIIWCSKDKAKEVWPDLEGDKLIEMASNCMKAEVKIFSSYLSGSVYGFVIEHPLSGVVESCGGFYSTKEAIEVGKEWADGIEVNETSIRIELAMQKFSEIRELLMTKDTEKYMHAGAAMIGSTCGNLRLQLKDILEEL